MTLIEFIDKHADGLAVLFVITLIVVTVCVCAVAGARSAR